MPELTSGFSGRSMIATMLHKLRTGTALSAALVLAAALLTSASAAVASAGLAVVVANSYDGFLPASLRDAGAIADKLEDNDFDAVRLLSASGGEMAAGLALIRQAAAKAGPVRIVYMSGFGMCINDDLVLFSEDVQPEQFKSGDVGEVVVPLSVVADAVAEGAERIFIVFDTNPRQCTRDMVNGLGLPENTTLLITTGIGGDIVDEVDEGGMSAFASAFVEDYSADQPIKDIIAQVMTQIREITEDQQIPFLVGNPQ